MDLFSHKVGQSAVLVSMPHSGTYLPPWLERQFSDHGLAVADTDWHIPQLYNFLNDLDVTVLQANYSRYVVDLNRSTDGVAMYPGQTETGLCPIRSFAGEPLYLSGEVLAQGEVESRVNKYWRPYHQKLASEIQRLRKQHGFAIVWDAHSIKSAVPRLFSGYLPDLNLGTALGRSCSSFLEEAVTHILTAQSGFSVACNGRFTGGAITRHYGQPSSNVHALQMEIAQRTYMHETNDCSFDEERAAGLRPLLRQMIVALMEGFSDPNGAWR